MSIRSMLKLPGQWLAQLGEQLDHIQIARRPFTWYLQGWRGGILLLLFAFLIPSMVSSFGDSFGLDQSFVLTLVTMGIYIILALGLNIVVGYAGLLDLGYVAFYVIGAYTMAVLSSGVISDANGHAHAFRQTPFWWLLPLGALLAGLFGVLLGAPTLRLRGDYLAIVTLGFGEIVPIVFNNLPYFGSVGGATATRPDPVSLPFGITFDFSSFLDYSPYYYLMLILLALVVLLVTSLRESSLGRAWVAIREDETAAAASGVNLVRTKLLAFGMGASIAGLAGVLSAATITHIEPGSFSFSISITVLVMIVLGGISSIPGVIVGAAALAFYDQFLSNRLNETLHSYSFVTSPDSPFHFLNSLDLNQAKLLFFGIILLAMILLRPQGLIPDVRRKRELTGIGEAPEELSVVGALEQEHGGATGSDINAHMTEYTGPGSDARGRED